MASKDASTGSKWVVHRTVPARWVPHGGFAVAAFRSPDLWSTGRTLRFVRLAITLAVFAALDAEAWTLRGAIETACLAGVITVAVEMTGFGSRGWVVVLVFAHEVRIGQHGSSGRPSLGVGFKTPKGATRIPWSEVEDLRVDDEGLLIERRDAVPVRIVVQESDLGPLYAELLNRWTRYRKTRSDTPRSAERARRAVEALR